MCVEVGWSSMGLQAANVQAPCSSLGPQQHPLSVLSQSLPLRPGIPLSLPPGQASEVFRSGFNPALHSEVTERKSRAPVGTGELRGAVGKRGLRGLWEEESCEGGCGERRLGICGKGGLGALWGEEAWGGGYGRGVWCTLWETRAMG